MNKKQRISFIRDGVSSYCRRLRGRSKWNRIRFN